MKTSRFLYAIAPFTFMSLLTACFFNTDTPSQNTDNDSSKYTKAKVQNLNNSEFSQQNPNIQGIISNKSPSVKSSQNIINLQESNSKSKYFTIEEINDLSKAFGHDSCDMAAFDQQTEKYNFNNNYGNPYVDGQDDIEELSSYSKCLLVQQANISVFSDEIFKDSNGYVQSRPKEADLKSKMITMLTFHIDYLKYPSCTPFQFVDPFTITFSKDESGLIKRSIKKNEYQVFECYENAMKNILNIKDHPVKIDNKWLGTYEYSTYEIDESKGIGYGAEYTIKLSQDDCHIDIVGYQADKHFACNVAKASNPDYIEIYQLDNQNKFGEIKYESPSKYFININYYDKYEGVDDKFDEIEKTK